MSAPVIYLAFANDPDDHLSLLKDERRALKDAMKELVRKQYIALDHEDSASTRDVFSDVTNTRGKLVIFHYGGHATGSRLKLESGEGDAKGLAQLLGDQEDLRLVFLNGCSTRGQVQLLFDAGVKAVIATSVSIADDKAKHFAAVFYESLAHRRTIEQAFNAAKSFLMTQYGSQLQSAERGVLVTWGDDGMGDELPWGLYLKPGHDDIRHYKLPYYREVGLPPDMINYIGESFTANKYIVSVLDEMCRFNPDIYDEMLTTRGGEQVRRDSREYPGIIIENFPWPIGSQILLLKHYDGKNRKRLEHLVSTYVVTSQVLYYILLSDLWDAKFDTPEADIQWEHPVLSQTAWLAYDFFGQLEPLYQRLNAIRTPFVTEFEMLIKGLEEPTGKLTSAHTYLEKLRARLAGDTPDEELAGECENAEKALRWILNYAAFLANYRMLTVRNVSINKPRHASAEYELDMGPLNAQQSVMLNLYQDYSSRRKSSYSDSSSVILTANENRLNQSLNLSPFIIDKNTFVRVKKSETTEKDRIAHIFMMAWQEENRLYYISLNHSIYHAMQARSDQLHTDQTQENYTSGSNVGASYDTPADDDLFAQAAATTAADETRIFEMLKHQYDMMKADLNP